MNPKTEFSNRIIMWQREHGYSNAECARLIGVDVANIVRWKSGQYLPSLDNYRKLCSVGIDFSNIENIPSHDFNAQDFLNFCKENKIFTKDICDMVGVPYATGYGFTKNDNSRNIESIAKLEKFVKEYGQARKSIVVEGIQENYKFTFTPLEESIIVPVQQENTCTDEGQEEITTLNTEPSRRPYNKNVTLKELLSFAEKFNIMDAEIRTDGGFDIIGFKLLVEEDGVPQLRLKTR